MLSRLSLLPLLLLTVALVAADKDETFLDPANAGPDYAIQGEYAGEVADAAKSKLGCQVVALGGGAFRAVFCIGGLPGDGWDAKTKVEVEGKTDGDKTSFAADGKYSGVIAAQALTGATDKGDKFALKRVVRESPTVGAKPPAGAIVLFDGSNVDAWEGAHYEEARKLIWSGAKTKQAFGDFTAHVEFILPFKPYARGQERGNSGFYLQDRYEIQVLDSFGLKGLNNECGGLYSKVAPAVNMCYPPLTWQTYDIDFTAARYDAEGKKTANAYAHVVHNGTVIHDKLDIPGPTGGGQKEEPKPGKLQLQGHGNPVFYRNIWVIEKK